ncbi:unnamed protein product [Rhodiola kirilowii]
MAWCAATARASSVDLSALRALSPRSRFGGGGCAPIGGLRSLLPAAKPFVALSMSTDTRVSVKEAVKTEKAQQRLDLIPKLSKLTTSCSSPVFLALFLRLGNLSPTMWRNRLSRSVLWI